MRALYLLIALSLIGLIYWKANDSTVLILHEGELFSSNNERSLKPTKILFVGDMMFDRSVASRMEKNGRESVLKNARELFRGNDLIIGNLEGTITTNESIAQQDNSILRFTFDPKITELLKKYNFNAVSLANNHSSDFYKDGYDQTIKYLTEQGIDYFGSAVNVGKLSSRMEVNGWKICLVGYHDLYTFDELPAVNEVSTLRPDCDYIVVFAHWGDEYKTVESERQRFLAAEFVDAGADLVIGAHPHVVEPVEIYNGKAVFYSLGNFVFDQDFSWETTHGLAVQVELDEDIVEFTQIPITINHSEVNIATSTDRARILQRTEQLETFTVVK